MKIFEVFLKPVQVIVFFVQAREKQTDYLLFFWKHAKIMRFKQFA